MTGSATLIGLVHGDVHPGVAHRVPGGREPLHVAELGEDRDRGQRPDPVMGHQCLAPGLAARIGAQLLGDLAQLHLERVDHRDSDRYLLARALRQGLGCEPLASLAGHERAALRTPVVEEHRLNPLLPLPTLIGQRVAQPDTRAQIEDMLGWNPRLREPVRPSKAPADAWHPRDRSWRASCYPAAQRSPPAPRDAPQHPPRAAPAPRTATQS